MSDYDNVLAEFKQKGKRLANQYILELYNILRYEEKLPHEDCRARIEYDCLDLLSRATLRKYLPQDSEDFKKQVKGKIGSENKKNKTQTMNKTNDKEKIERAVDIDEKVIERAKHAGIDVPAITDKVLKDMTYAPTGNTVHDIIDAQEKLLEPIQPILKEYNMELEIGSVYWSGSSFWPNRGKLKGYKYSEYWGGKIIIYRGDLVVLNRDPEKTGAIDVTVSDVWEDLYPPAKIIENFIIALLQAVERNRRKIIEWEFVSRFVKVFQQSLENKTQGIWQRALFHRNIILASSRYVFWVAEVS